MGAVSFAPKWRAPAKVAPKWWALGPEIEGPYIAFAPKLRALAQVAPKWRALGPEIEGP